MIRTVFMIGLFAVAGLFVLKLLFGVFGAFFSILLSLLGWAVWITVIGALIYLVIRVVSPDTARRLRERWSNNV